MLIRLLIFLFLLTCATEPEVYAQSKQNKSRAVSRDTSEVYYFYTGNPKQDLLVKDTILDRNFLQYELSRIGQNPWFNLGLPGTAAHKLVFEPRQKMGFDLGWSTFELYQTPLDSVRYYKAEQAYSRASFFQGLTLDRVNLGAEYAREFANSVNLSAQYIRINNEGFYNDQFTKQSSLVINSWWQNKSKRYSAFLAFVSDINNQLENGGISSLPKSEDLSRDSVSNPVFATTYLNSTSNARNTHNIQRYRYDHTLALNKQKLDSLGRSRSFLIQHIFNYESSQHKYVDNVSDTIFYGTDFITDERGVRHLIKSNLLENSFNIRTNRSQISSNQNTNRSKDQYTIGLLHRLQFVEQEPRSFTKQEIFATWRGDFTPNERLGIKTQAHLGFVDRSAGDYRWQGELSFKFPKIGNFEFISYQQLSIPSLIQESIYTTGKEVYNQEFKKSLSTHFGSRLYINSLKLELNVGYNLLGNYIFFGSDRLPQQIEAVINVGYLSVSRNIKFGPVHLDNKIWLQTSSNDAVSVVPFFSRHSIYYRSLWFKQNMMIQIGADVRLNSPFTPYAYFPIYASFHVQNQQTTDWQPLLDAHLAFKVSKFRFLFRLDNIIPIITRSNFYYHVADYPLAHSYARFGFSWQFVD